MVRRWMGASGLTERIDLARVWALALPVAAIALAACGVCIVLTFLPGDVLVPDGLVFALLFGAFPVHLGSIVTAARFAGGRRWSAADERALTSALSWWQRRAIEVAFAACGLLALFTFLRIDGQAERHDGRYYLSNEGELTEVGRDEYIEQRKLQQRALSAGPAWLYIAAIRLGLGHRRRRHLPATRGKHQVRLSRRLGQSPARP